jgi:hypothetical protein
MFFLVLFVFHYAQAYEPVETPAAYFERRVDGGALARKWSEVHRLVAADAFERDQIYFVSMQGLCEQSQRIVEARLVGAGWNATVLPLRVLGAVGDFGCDCSVNALDDADDDASRYRHAQADGGYWRKMTMTAPEGPGTDPDRVHCRYRCKFGEPCAFYRCNYDALGTQPVLKLRT